MSPVSAERSHRHVTQTASVRQPDPHPSPRSATTGVSVPWLQRTVGNQAVVQLLDGSPHPSVRTSAVDSPAERDAAHFAESRQRPSSTGRAAEEPRSAVDGSSGVPLDPSLRFCFEQQLGADLSRVRIHDDRAAHRFTAGAGARAATLGSRIYFSEGRWAPGSEGGRRLLAHELVHTLQDDHGTLHRTPESEARLRVIEQQLQSMVITDEHRAALERERAELLRRGKQTGAATPFAATAGSAGSSASALPQPLDTVSMGAAEFEALTGMSAALLPEAPAHLVATDGVLPPAWPGGAAASVGGSALFMPQPTWYYRVLQPHDPAAAQILRGASLLPRAPDPGFTFQPELNPAEMTFRHMRPGGNVPRLGTDRISTAADLEAFRTILRERGTGELVRVDVEAARRLGAQFLESGDIMAHLDEIGARITRELEAARLANRGVNAIRRLEGRMRALEAARSYARTFAEGHGVGSIPGRAVTRVPGRTLSGAVAGEAALTTGMRAFRFGGRVLIVVGVGMSVQRVRSAPPGQGLRVATQEAGGWAFSIPAAGLGAKAGAAAGAAFGIESGPGAVVTAAIGAMIGGAIGFFGGQEAADAIYDAAETTSRPVIEKANDLGRYMERNIYQLYGVPWL